VRDRIGIEPERLHLAASRRIVCGINGALKEELCESSRRVPLAKLRDCA